MFLLTQLYLLVTKLFLAGKDASSYLLKDRNATGSLTNNRIKRWHRDGVALDILSTLPLAYINGSDWTWVIFVSVLIRLAFFDLAFNHWASLDINLLGSTAWVDRQFEKVFGPNGAVQKSIVFLIALIVFDILKAVFKF